MGFKKLIDLDLLDRFLTGVKALIPSTYAGSSSAGGPATVANGIPYGVVDSTSTKTKFTATVSGVTTLYDGLVILLKNNVVASASGCTLNVNSLGAKPIHYSTALNTGISTTYSATMTALFYYDSTRDSGNGAWVLYYGYDSNTNTIGYQIRTNSMSLPMSDIVYRYRLLFTSADGTKFVPANTSTSTKATTAKSVCQTKINPFGRIVYYGTTDSVAADSRPSTSYLWQQYNVTLGYSFNVSGGDLALTSWKPCYLKCAPQSDGSAIMDSATPIVQELPSTEDGKIYIFLGIASSATTMELTLEHPVYYFADGAVRPWINQNGSSGGAVDSVNGQTGTVVLDATDVGLGNVDNVQQYSVTNPPPYPVASVNGNTGAVTIRELPSVTSSDNGKFLCVDNGAWAAVTVPNANGVSF